MAEDIQPRSDRSTAAPAGGNGPTLLIAFKSWWREERRRTSVRCALWHATSLAWEFVRDSLPDRKRQRYGDADFDWQYRVNTTSGGLGWRARLIGLLTSSYQPLEQELFCEMLNALGIDYSGFTFIDIGSGKGRALLMASTYPFRRILGIELLPELNAIAQENISRYANPEQRSEQIESVCADATTTQFPAEPLVVYLFHPLPQAGFKTVIENLERSQRENPRSVYVVYANPVFEQVLLERKEFRKLGGTHQYSLFCLDDSSP